MKKFFFLYCWFIKQLINWQFLPLYILAIGSTYIIVHSGLDWRYFVWVYQHDLNSVLYIADGLGFIIAILLPLILYGSARYTRELLYPIYTEATVYCVILGFTVSTGIKMFTGRTSPPHHHYGKEQILVDNSYAFNFGFMREQIIGGWPSSHTTIMVALALCVYIMLPIHWWYKLPIFGIAIFVGIGVTFGFHWLSEFIAGTLLGIAIGSLVGTYYKSKLSNLKQTNQA